MIWPLTIALYALAAVLSLAAVVELVSLARTGLGRKFVTALALMSAASLVLAVASVYWAYTGHGPSVAIPTTIAAIFLLAAAWQLRTFIRS